eukprot:10841099-Lingulodinium_polyedra.AAC.1
MPNPKSSTSLVAPWTPTPASGGPGQAVLAHSLGQGQESERSPTGAFGGAPGCRDGVAAGG